MSNSPISNSPTIGASRTPTEIKNSPTPTSTTPNETKILHHLQNPNYITAKFSRKKRIDYTESPKYDKNPIPSITDVEQISEQTPKLYEVTAGINTEELSDISEFEATLSKSLQSMRFSALLIRISPFIRNKKVRTMLVVNFIITIINTLLLLALLTFIIWNIVLYVHVNAKCCGIDEISMSFTYLEWSNCSSECRTDGEDYPRRYRKVNKTSIIQARGGAQPECPENLADQIDSAPCNTYLCPTKLSEYNFTDTCYYNDANLRDYGGCYRIRNVPLDDRLIFIDTYLTEECNCSNVSDL
ncbi:Complement component c6 [Dirofilaria immitis]|nr:Complement component c6 [Dirofilaria immitis]